MVHYDLVNLHIEDYTGGKDGCLEHHLAIVEEENMVFYRLDSIEDMLEICKILNGGS